jgi:hypothetical protein
MSRTLAVLGFVVIIGLTACAPVAPAGLPTFVAPGATAEINSAYPTQQAAQQNASQTVGGFAVDLQRAWRDGKQVNAAVCFVLPDASDWTIWNAHFDYSGQSVAEFSTSMVSRKDPNGNQPGQRCDQLSFYVPPDADLSSASLTIDSIGAYPTQDEYCSLYLPKIQQAMADRNTGISVDCSSQNGAMLMQIASKPAGMSQEDAEKAVYSDEFYTVKGPWTFPVTFGQ